MSIQLTANMENLNAMFSTILGEDDSPTKDWIAEYSEDGTLTAIHLTDEQRNLFSQVYNLSYIVDTYIRTYSNLDFYNEVQVAKALEIAKKLKTKIEILDHSANHLSSLPWAAFHVFSYCLNFSTESRRIDRFIEYVEEELPLDKELEIAHTNQAENKWIEPKEAEVSAKTAEKSVGFAEDLEDVQLLEKDDYHPTRTVDATPSKGGRPHVTPRGRKCQMSLNISCLSEKSSAQRYLPAPPRL